MLQLAGFPHASALSLISVLNDQFLKRYRNRETLTVFNQIYNISVDDAFQITEQFVPTRSFVWTRAIP